ncbi:FxSxx-COOH system tetratricopeptide repeat protein [[Actinomadura] parvosata]|uniref:FxSxx-COOH system tetratricopeptide repeat protein n=1 Tax=[Actinomadura] parvosata TaxID=1955412 RepID=UPI0012BBEF8E|nr:FxSxx-COOH system tetratricopeptide repeat protein [Nonomuraea sp. ATCC 55076]
MSVSHYSPESGQLPAIWGRVPQRNMNFTGRVDLLRSLHEGLMSDVTAVVPHALHGLGGVGKTQLAIEYAHRFRKEYELVWWIPADQPMLVKSSLAGLARELRLPIGPSTGVEEAAEAALDALRRGVPYTKWLLIFDNADEVDEINAIAPRGPGHVLITSRNHSWQGVVDTLAVDVFPRAESIEFLIKRVPHGITETEADELAEALGDLPLALEQAGALQVETTISVKDYLRLLDEQTTRLLGTNKPADYPLSMSAAWALSVSQLTTRMPIAVELLRCCAFFGPEPIPRDLFDRLPPEFAEGSMLAETLADPILTSRILRELGRYALVRIDSASRTLQIHRLVQALLRDELSAEEREAMRKEAHLLLAAAADPYEPDDTAAWPRFGGLLGHVTPSQVDQSEDPRIRRFTLTMMRYLYSSGDFKSAQSLVDRCIAQWRATSGDDDQNVLSAQRHQAIILRELGNLGESFSLNQRLLVRMREVLGEDHEETLLLLNSHGADLRFRGDFAAALQHDLDSLRRHEEVFGREHRRTLRAMNNLALDYLLLGDYERALDLQSTTFRLQRRPGSQVSSMNVLSSWNGLARVVRLSGKYREACDIGEDAYEFGVEQLGVEHPWTLRVAKDLSIAKRRDAKAEEALDLAHRTFELQVRNVGMHHPDTLAAGLCLANAQRTSGETAEALALLEELTPQFETMYGADHPFKYGCDTNLALLLRVNGRADEAVRVDNQALDGLDRRLTRDHHFTLTCAINLASDLAEMGEHERARRLGENTLSRLRELLGPDHPLTLAAAANLVVDLAQLGEKNEAEALKADTLQRYLRVLGPGHPDVDVAEQRRRLDFDFDPPVL